MIASQALVTSSRKFRRSPTDKTFIASPATMLAKGKSLSWTGRPSSTSYPARSRTFSAKREERANSTRRLANCGGIGAGGISLDQLLSVRGVFVYHAI